MIELEFALNTFYLLVCAALVMWMAAGFTMLESGLVRARNTVEILTKNVALYSIACLMYFLCGYALMYPEQGVNGFWPGLGFGIPAEHSAEDVLAGGIDYSQAADFMFQVVFVATAMSIVSGAVAERMKLWSFLAFAVILTAVIYPLQGYWSWGGGYLDSIDYSDYAGGGIVHMAGATAALAGVWLLGPRIGKYAPDGRARALPGANLPLATLGMFVLWMGWFGFNGGSELAVAGIESAGNVARVFVNTNLAAASGLISALITARWLFGKADLTMTLNGALAGLVAITAGPLAPAPIAAVAIGLVAGVVVVFSILGLDRLRLDDPVGAISVHGSCGILGLLAAPLFDAEATFAAQLIGIGLIGGFVFAASALTWFLLALVLGIRVHPEDEQAGLDLVECGMEAYPDFAHGGDG